MNDLPNLTDDDSKPAGQHDGDMGPISPKQQEQDYITDDDPTVQDPNAPEDNQPLELRQEPRNEENPPEPRTEKTPERQTQQLPLAPQKNEAKQDVITLPLPNQPFADIIQQIRLDANVPIKEVSDKTRISATFINDLEQQHFEALPSLDFCLAKIEQLCLEYDVDSRPLIDKFCVEYQQHKGLNEQHAHANHPHARHTKNLIQNKTSKLPGLPAIFIAVVLILLLALLIYAFHAHQTHQMPNKLDADLTEHIPMHAPKVFYLDDIPR